MVGHDDVDGRVDHQLRVVLKIPFGFEHFGFLEEDLGIEDHAVADQTALPGMENTGRDDVHHRGFVPHHQGVTGVVSSLKANHFVRIFGVDIDDLALAFIPPLGAGR